MAVRSNLILPESVRELGNRIERWRNSREHLCAMPSDLWDEAATLARAHGIYAIAHALHVSYDSLKRHADGRRMKKRQASRRAPDFVELPPGAPIFGMAQADTVIEITSRVGDKLAIRVPAQTPLDLGGLASAFIAKRS